MIPVTKSFLPPIENYISNLKRAYENQWLTNRGELVQELEQNLTDYLELEDSKILCMNNGTIPIQIALKLLANEGEVITTPFSYVATSAAILWEKCTPVFVDIHPEYLTIDESKIVEVITEKTTCILATHVFGNPCEIEAIDRIAKEYNLKVIYDAAHCFGVKYKGKSIFEFGDISTCSFHATKLFHTGEGGASFSKDKELTEKLFYSHNFGHNGQIDYHGLGINGKLSELQAAMGLSVLPFLKEIISKRKKIFESYNKNLNFSRFGKLKLREYTSWNFSYYPVIFNSERELLTAIQELNKKSIYPRRYFYPSLNTIDIFSGISCPISESVSKRILCLPLYNGLNYEEVKLISELLNKIFI